MFGGVDLAHPDFAALEQRIDRLIELAGATELVADHAEPLPREGALNIAFVPKEFQIRAEEFDDSFVFAGPGIRPSEFTGDWTPPADGRPVVLVSLGTTTNKRPEVFRTLLDGLRDQPWRVVVTIGRDGDAAALEPVPDIVEIHRWLDQHSVLRHASLFVNQGGVGSVMQGLYWGVPQVLVTDDDDTALAGHQIVRLGLGREIHTDELTPELLRDSALAVLSDHTIAGAARAMSEHVRRPGADDAADRVEALCNQQEVAVR
jgi:MGT family glycosyltransferase